MTFVDLPDSGLALYPASSPEFEQILAARVDGESRTAIEAILPYSVILVNRSSSPLVAVVVRSDLTDATGRTTSSDMMVSTMNMNSLIPVGAQILMTPVSGLNTVLRPDRPMSLSPGDDLRRMVERRGGRFQSQSRVKISLDSVVYSDGSVLGPDTINNLARMNAWIEAERALINEVLRADSSTRSALLDDARAPRDVPPGSIDDLSDHRRRAAQMISGWRSGSGSNWNPGRFSWRSFTFRRGSNTSAASPGFLFPPAVAVLVCVAVGNLPLLSSRRSRLT